MCQKGQRCSTRSAPRCAIASRGGAGAGKSTQRTRTASEITKARGGLVVVVVVIDVDRKREEEGMRRPGAETGPEVERNGWGNGESGGSISPS